MIRSVWSLTRGVFDFKMQIRSYYTLFSHTRLIRCEERRDTQEPLQDSLVKTTCITLPQSGNMPSFS